MTTIKQWLAPPHFEDEAKDRTARYLHYLLLSCLVLIGIGIVTQIFTNSISEITGTLWLILFALEIGLKRGYIKVAAYIFVISGWLALSVSAWLGNGMYGAIVPGFLALTLLTGLLLGWREATLFTALSTIYIWMLAYAQINNFISVELLPIPLLVTNITIIYIISAIILGLTISSLENAVNRVTASEELLASANKELQQAQEQLEVRVEQRTQELALAAEIGRNVSQIRDLGELTTTAVSLIRQRFNLYHAQLYLVDAGQNTLTLLASTGEAGQQMLAAGHTLMIDETSINGRAASQKQPVLVADTAINKNFLPHELLPKTRSETAVPLIAGDTVVGVLDLQSNQPNAFTEENLPAFVILAGLLAVAIENSTLFTEQKLAESRLAGEEQRTRKILESIGTPLVIAKAKDGTIVYVNEPAAQLMGIAREELMGKVTPNFFKNPVDRQIYVDSVRQHG